MARIADHMTRQQRCRRTATSGALAGRVWLPEVAGPAVVAIRADGVHDISRLAPTMRDLCEADNPAAIVRDGKGERIGALEAILANTPEATRDATKPWLLAPNDLQAIKAAGVTFPLSMLERVIEEQARGAPEKCRGDAPERAGPARRQHPLPGAGQPAGGRTQARANRAGRVVPVPGGWHRPGCGDLHQGPAHVSGRTRHGGRTASHLELEQSGT